MLAVIPDMEIDMQSIQAAEVLKTYWLLYPKIQEDFVHKSDLTTILESNMLTGVANPPDFTLKGRVTWVMPTSTDINGKARIPVYKAAYQAGDAVKEGATEAIKEILS